MRVREQNAPITETIVSKHKERTMRKMIALALALAVVGFAPSAFAQDEGGEETRTKFYNFDDMLIDGQFKKPDIMKQKAREKAKFNRLSKLKKDFLPKVVETSEEQALQ